MSPRSFTAIGVPYGFPRVSGDEPGQSLEATATVKFSPRERG